MNAKKESVNHDEISMVASQTQFGISKARMETLTDGLFAIVMTLLVFQLMSTLIADATTAGELHSALILLWPKFVSFTISFVIISVFWVSHHTYFYTIQGMDETLIWLNLLFLFCISLIPFSADLIGEHHNLHIAGIIYGLNLAVTTCALRLTLRHALRRHMVRADLDIGAIKKINNRWMVLFFSSLLGVAIALFNPLLSFYFYIINAFVFLVLQILIKPMKQLVNSNQDVEGATASGSVSQTSLPSQIKPNRS